MKKSFDSRAWGFRGLEAIERIERGLDVALGCYLRDFVLGVGNLMVAPFEIVLGGDDAGRYSGVTQTHALWQYYPALKPLRAIQLMDHAGQVYLYFPKNERVCAYDALRPVPGEELLSWENFDQFMGWVFEEAQGMKREDFGGIKPG